MIDVLTIFPALNSELIILLKSLKPADWERKTVCSSWTIRDIAIHLLDTNLRRLSIGRDGHSASNNQEFNNYDELVNYLNQQNADWVKALQRVSPVILIEMIAQYQNQLLEYFNELDPFDTALFSVRWAGKEHSENWFDIAREYTERWLHQQQIRFALNDQKLLSPQFYHPFLTTAMQALPYTYVNVKAPIGTVVKVEIVGEAGGSWSIIKDKNFWSFVDDEVGNASALIFIDQQIAWLLFSKGINPMDAAQYYQLHGDTELASHALKMLAVMA
ncbi:maleylpyruvate isomerase N-terminal domain-containing protein [Pedobacter cryophilus]|uniref:Maleylpyruvate isomerase family protein n=1 Tax=Pedobacter cryophilus TaxID=2571271 RepID=A0A4U1C6D2_9SPHI|nr:maleylpyruvate isomerase N-terminal domain-containing protein [Pedobacter cryophilus]TKC00942.1 maleylpyruvate isomerase family protein [Pedobacter cryophilus]